MLYCIRAIISVMKATKKNKKLAIITVAVVALVLIVAIVAVVVAQQNNKCDAIACASGDKCVAPNDAIVSCEELRKNPGKTDWGPGGNQ